MENEKIDVEQIALNLGAAGEGEQVAKLQAKIAELERSRAELADALLREKAENENAKKRSAKELEECHKYAVSNFALDMTEVLENLYRALDNVSESVVDSNEYIKNFVEGIEMTSKILSGIFDKHGLSRIYPLNEKFDHNFHQAVSQTVDDSKEPNTVLNVIASGYKIKDRLLKAALVVLSTRS